MPISVMKLCQVEPVILIFMSDYTKTYKKKIPKTYSIKLKLGNWLF